MKKQSAFLAAAIAALSGAVIAQTRERPDPQEVQAELERKAVRIPRAPLAAALRTSETARSDRARIVRRRANMEELRATIEEARARDAAEAVAIEDLSAVRSAPAPRAGIRAASARSLQIADASEAERVRVPLLLPASPALQNRFRIYGMENVYTATAPIDRSADLSISGTCNRVVGGDPDMVEFRKRLALQPRRLTAIRADYYMSRNDFGVDLSFSRFGCGYVMTIECANPADDVRCAEDDFISELADAMILANPELAGGE